METENIVYLLISLFVGTMYIVLLFRYLYYFHNNQIFDYIDDKKYSSIVSYSLKYSSIIIYMFLLFSISFIPFMLLMKLNYTNVTVFNLIIFYLNELYDFLASLYSIEPIYNYPASKKVFFKIFFYNSIVLFFICLLNCLALFLFKMIQGSVWKTVVFTIIILFVWEVVSPVIKKKYLSSSIRSNPLVSKIENSVIKVALIWNDDVGDYVDKVRDKIFPDKKKEDSTSNTINFIERNKKFR